MVRYVHLPSAAVDTALLEDATRRGLSTPTGEEKAIADLRCESRSCVASLQASMTKTTEDDMNSNWPVKKGETDMLAQLRKLFDLIPSQGLSAHSLKTLYQSDALRNDCILG